MTTTLTVADIAIKQDSEGRYCLNDFHKAAGGERKHGPSLWLTNQQTKELVTELGDTGNPVSVTKGGPKKGTYACKELVYAYAMWVSPKFHLHVIRTYDQVVQAQVAEERRQAAKALELVSVQLDVAHKQVDAMVDQVSYMTLQQYRALTGVQWPRKIHNTLGILLRSKCEKNGLEVRKFDQNGWSTNSYPTHLLDEVVEDYGLYAPRTALSLGARQ